MLTVADLKSRETSLREYCARVADNIDEFDFDEKRLAMQSLQIKASSTESQVFVKGILGVDGINQAVINSPSPDPVFLVEGDVKELDSTRNLATTARTLA
jgi:hypothetical protein